MRGMRVSFCCVVLLSSSLLIINYRGPGKKNKQTPNWRHHYIQENCVYCLRACVLVCQTKSTHRIPRVFCVYFSSSKKSVFCVVNLRQSMATLPWPGLPSRHYYYLSLTIIPSKEHMMIVIFC